MSSRISFFLFCVIVVTMSIRTSAFVVPPAQDFQVLSSQISTTAVHLHPDQAEDLEACAYDLTKDYLRKKGQLAASLTATLSNAIHDDDEEGLSRSTTTARITTTTTRMGNVGRPLVIQNFVGAAPWSRWCRRVLTGLKP